MKKLGQLTEFLLGFNFVAAEQLESWAEDVELISRYDPRGAGGLVLFERQYTAWFVVERFPHRIIAPDLFFAQAMVWLMDHDPDRDNLDRPRIDVDILDNDLADLSLTIKFTEEVGIVPDENGPIDFMSQTWRLADPEIWIAEQGEVLT